MNNVAILFIIIGYVSLAAAFLKFKEKKEDEINNLNNRLINLREQKKTRDEIIRDYSARNSDLQKALQEEYKFVDNIVIEYNNFVEAINKTYNQNLPSAKKEKANKDLN